MPSTYYMGPNNPCPACGGNHHLSGVHGVPYYEAADGATFEVTCPDSGQRVEVVISPDVPPDRQKMTELQCPTCLKAFFFVVSEERKGPNVVQRLECSNTGCGQQHSRLVDLSGQPR